MVFHDERLRRHFFFLGAEISVEQCLAWLLSCASTLSVYVLELRIYTVEWAECQTLVRLAEPQVV